MDMYIDTVCDAQSPKFCFHFSPYRRVIHGKENVRLGESDSMSTVCLVGEFASRSRVIGSLVGLR